MHSDMDKYEGLLQQLAFGVDIKKAMCIVELNAHLWGPVVMGFGPCGFGLAEPSGSYIGEKLETEGNKKELRNRREKGSQTPSSHYQDHLIICDLLTSVFRSRYGQRGCVIPQASSVGKK